MFVEATFDIHCGEAWTISRGDFKERVRTGKHCRGHQATEARADISKDYIGPHRHRSRQQSNGQPIGIDADFHDAFDSHTTQVETSSSSLERLFAAFVWFENLSVCRQRQVREHQLRSLARNTYLQTYHQNSMFNRQLINMTF